MLVSLLKRLSILILFAACTSTSRNTRQTVNNYPVDDTSEMQPVVDSGKKLQSLMDLPQTQDGGFVLSPGFYEAEFKTYCLQPGTPDPSVGDAYLQGPVTGYRKDIVESVLFNSRSNTALDQRNIQLLLWSVVSGADFNKLSPSVQYDAMKLLTPKQVFELKGGVIGLIKTVSSTTGILNSNSSMRRLFDAGTSSYESFERLAVLKEPSQIRRTGVKADQWYKQQGDYYVRYFPVSYKKVRIQVYVPDGLLDAEGKLNGQYLVYDPTGQQASPAFTNAQRLGVGTPVADVVRVIIQVSKKSSEQKKPVEQNKPVERPKRQSPKVKQF